VEFGDDSTFYMAAKDPAFFDKFQTTTVGAAKKGLTLILQSPLIFTDYFSF
jgi:hypothetical protein